MNLCSFLYTVRPVDYLAGQLNISRRVVFYLTSCSLSEVVKIDTTLVTIGFSYPIAEGPWDSKLSWHISLPYLDVLVY